MIGSEKRVIRALQERGEATRPQLAAATGLSLVTVNHVVAKLSRSGEVRSLGVVPSGGGRPVQLYGINPGHGCHIIIRLAKEGNLLRGELEQLDMTGTLQHHKSANFAYIDSESFDGWLDPIMRRHHIRSITLYTDAPADLKETAYHLQKRYGCKVRTPSCATLLSARKDGELTLCLPDGAEASGAYVHGGKTQSCGTLSLLPLPCNWQEIDHTDRVLLEETVARLLQILICILAPTRICLYTPAWSSRLMERIRYNTSTKMKGKLPAIRFAPLTEDAVLSALREYSVRM